jgi:hypothetical protein
MENKMEIMSKSKDEILWSFPQGESEPYGGVPVNRIYEAMDKYAKQQSIAFAEWLNATNWAEKDTWGKYDPPSMPTTEELYNLFTQSTTLK